MTLELDRGSMPPQLSRARDSLAALGGLLVCADPEAWNSMARPDPAALGALMFTLHGEVTEGLKELGFRGDS